ncbi:hypothetical protein EDF46_2376 [Frondihabitans sp. PhB188]|nr:hypothetical protein EDF46_2376 [Frondihabitans sp. PhB188]
MPVVTSSAPKAMFRVTRTRSVSGRVNRTADVTTNTAP